MNNNSARLYNMISIFFLVLTLVVIVYVALQMASGKEEVVVRPLSELPTMIPATDTHTPTASRTPTIPPSFTPTGTFTTTPTLTLTPSITLPPSETITATPRFTDTPVPTDTPDVTDTPTEINVTPTDSPFFFDLAEDIVYQPNATAAGCQFQAIAGSVIGLDGLESANRYVVHAIGPNLDRTRETGTNTFYGPVSGWEILIAQQPLVGEYVVRLESLAGTPLSPDFRVLFPGNCTSNIAILRFQQIRPLGR